MSPLLNLPSELRNRIYQLCVGDRELHVRCQILPSQGSEDADEEFIRPRAAILSHGICKAGITKVEECERSNRRSHTSKYVINNYDNLHQDCADGGKLDLRLLGTCKQIYQEAKLIPYSTNIFSFSKALTFDRFMSSRLPNQLHAIGGLHFILVLSSMEGQKWNEGFVNPCVKSLTGLRTLHVCIKQKFEHLCSYKNMKDGAYDAVNGLLILRCHPLSVVTVGFSDGNNSRRANGRLPNPHMVRWGRLETEFRWTADQKRDYAEFLKTKLLEVWDGDVRSHELKALNMQKQAFESARQHLQAKIDINTKRYQLLTRQYAVLEDDAQDVQSRVDEIEGKGQ